MEDKKIEIYQETLKRLADILNTQESLVEKIGVAQVELFNSPDSFLEKKLNEIGTSEADSYERIKKTIEEIELALYNA